MRALFTAWLVATAVRALPQMAANFSLINEPTDTMSCAGTSTYDFEPTSTVYVTVDGEYTYIATVNATTPSDILYTPPPPCSSVIVPTLPTSTPLPTTSLDNTTTTSSLSMNSTFMTPSSTIPAPVLITTSIWYQTTICGATSTTISSSSISNTTTTKDVNGPYTNSTTASSTSSTSACETTWTAYTTVMTSGVYGPAHPSPLVPPAESTVTSIGGGRSSSFAASSSQVLSMETLSVSPFLTTAPMSSAVTVTVTKKTPVPASQPVTTAGQIGEGGQPSISFPDGSTETVPITAQSKQTPPVTQSSVPGVPLLPTNGGSSVQSNTYDNGGRSSITTNSGNPPGNTPGIVFPPQSPGNSGPGGSSNANNNNGGSPSTSSISSAGSGGIGSIINSAFNSPFTPVIVPVPVTTVEGAASATATLVAGVPVQIGSSSVYVGGSNVVLPTGTSTVLVTIAGQTFTIEPSAVVAAGSTLSIERDETTSYSNEKVQVATLAASTITNGHITITVEPSAAVISGTTIPIGLGASSTKIVVSGTTLTFNSNGVIFPSTTYAPAITTAPAYVVTTLGHLTISIDSSEAIISGTTFRIGAGALNSATTTTIDGTAITFGPSGIVLPSTTIAPTEVDPTKSGSTSASAATRIVSDTATATRSGNVAMSLQRPPGWLSNTVCVVGMLIGLGTLPLSLVL